MAMYRVSATKVIAAPAARVYDLLADYREGHPSILPKAYFISHTVEQGGRGAGTVVAFQMKLMGRTQSFRSTISEPEPGRVLVETVLSNGPAEVYARWLDPTSPELGALMPGALMARDDDGRERVLATYGMAAFELKTPAGEDLVLKSGQFVEIEIPIPAELAGTAPTEIPLWYFDLEEERWLGTLGRPEAA